MKKTTGSKGGLRGNAQLPVFDNDGQPVSVNEKPIRILPAQSLADKVGLASPSAKPVAKPNKTMIIPPPVRSQKTERADETVVDIVPINRRVAKASKIKHLQREKNENAVNVTAPPKEEDRSSPSPANQNPINRKVIKPRTSDVYYKSEPRADNVSIIKSGTKNKNEKNLDSKHNSASSAQIPNEPEKATPELGRGVGDGGRLDQIQKNQTAHPPHTLGSLPKRTSDHQQSLKMIPIDAGIGEKPLSMVPIDAGIGEKPLSMIPIEEGRRPPVSTSAQPDSQTPKKSPASLPKSPTRRKQKRPEQTFGNFIDDLRIEADKQGFSLSVNPCGTMKIEFASQSRALMVAFEKKILPFNRIVVKQMMPPIIERRMQREEPDIKPGLISRLKNSLGMNLSKEREERRKGPRKIKQLIGHIRDDQDIVFDWESGPSTMDENNSALDNQVAVAAQYSDREENNFWSVQLVNDCFEPTDAMTPPLPSRHFSDTGIKRTLFALLIGLGDAIDADLIKAT